MLILICLGALPLTHALADDMEQLRLKQQAQEKARALAADLVSGIFDIQLRQLAENGLAHLPIYTEIKSMRANIDALVEDEMQEVIELLVKAQQGDRQQRIGHVNQARETIREVVAGLMAERQKLYRRLQIARVAMLVRQLIDAEVDVYADTKSLPEQAPGERERLTLNTIQDQRDASALFHQLVNTLKDVSSWGGQLGTAAAAGLRILEAAHVADELTKAEQCLAASKFDEAAQSELAVIKGLRALLGKIEEAQGLIPADHEAILNMVREMIDQQEKLRDTTRQSELRGAATKDEFAARQHQIRQDLSKLADLLRDFPTAEPQVEQAQAAAYQAETELFQGHKTEALLQQGRVIGGLALVEAQLQQAIDHEASDRTADELAGDMRALEQLDKALEQIAQTQSQATRNAVDKPSAARQLQQQVAQELAKASKADEFPRAVDKRLDDAGDAVAQAQRELEKESAEAAELREQATQQAEESIRLAGAEVKAQLAQANRAASSAARDQQLDASQAAGQPESQQPAPGRTSPTANTGRVSSPGDSAGKEPAEDMPLAAQPGAKGDGRTPNADGAGDVAPRRFHEAPWFAKLPPSLHEAIQATSRRAAPRGYEERLKRYFESID